MNADIISMVKALSSDMPYYEFEQAKLEIIDALNNQTYCFKHRED